MNGIQGAARVAHAKKAVHLLLRESAGAYRRCPHALAACSGVCSGAGFAGHLHGYIAMEHGGVFRNSGHRHWFGGVVPRDCNHRVGADRDVSVRGANFRGDIWRVFFARAHDPVALGWADGSHLRNFARGTSVMLLLDTLTGGVLRLQCCHTEIF
jgi:hypothetical protein